MTKGVSGLRSGIPFVIDPLMSHLDPDAVASICNKEIGLRRRMEKGKTRGHVGGLYGSFSPPPLKVVRT
jgi:hypothetical protein